MTPKACGDCRVEPGLGQGSGHNGVWRRHSRNRLAWIGTQHNLLGGSRDPRPVPSRLNDERHSASGGFEDVGWNLCDRRVDRWKRLDFGHSSGYGSDSLDHGGAEFAPIEIPRTTTQAVQAGVGQRVRIA